MPVIKLETFIDAPQAICFDLARSVDVHMASTDGTGERAVAGRTHGLMELGDTVTWEAKHFGVRQRLTSKITALDRPVMFVDEMQQGAFKSLHHLHRFLPQDSGTLMIDEMTFTSPFGILGRMVDAVVLENYMRRFLLRRNEYIKKVAEERQSARKS